MKTIKLILALLLVSAVGVNLSAQTSVEAPGKHKTETIMVSGNCDMCKARIEKAVKETGANSAEWSIKTKLLTLTFDPAKTSLDVIGKKIASVGHDTGKFKAEDKVYNALPACCKYERTK